MPIGSFQFTLGTLSPDGGAFTPLDLTDVLVIPGSVVDPSTTSFDLDATSPLGVVFGFDVALQTSGIAPGQDETILILDFSASSNGAPDNPLCIEVG